MKTPKIGSEYDGFILDEHMYSGGISDIYHVRPNPKKPDPGFALVMKIPCASTGDSAENMVHFEVECQIMSVLQGSHVPRFVAAGDLQREPYLLMEYVNGHTLQRKLNTKVLPSVQEIARLGASMARAVHAIHQQNTVHSGLNPARVLFRPDGSTVLLGFGRACHTHYPDLLAGRLHKPTGATAWLAPEQIVGVRGDARSDIFSLGVMLYVLCTGQLPFGIAQTPLDLRQRPWLKPIPPRKLRPELPEWLQEVVLRCLERHAVHRYASAALLSFDLLHPNQVAITGRGRKISKSQLGNHFKRWLGTIGVLRYRPSPLVTHPVENTPIAMVAVPYSNVTDATLYSLRDAVIRLLGTLPDARLSCVTVIAPTHHGRTSAMSVMSGEGNTASNAYRRHLATLQRWAQALDTPGRQISYHVLESNDVAQALLNYAAANHVGVIVMGAATHGRRTQRILTTVPIKVAMSAPCTVILVKPALPSGLLLSDQPVEEASGRVATDPSLYGDDLGPLG